MVSRKTWDFDVFTKNFMREILLSLIRYAKIKTPFLRERKGINAKKQPDQKFTNIRKTI